MENKKENNVLVVINIIIVLLMFVLLVNPFASIDLYPYYQLFATVVFIFYLIIMIIGIVKVSERKGSKKLLIISFVCLLIMVGLNYLNNITERGPLLNDTDLPCPPGLEKVLENDKVTCK